MRVAAGLFTGPHAFLDPDGLVRGDLSDDPRRSVRLGQPPIATGLARDAQGREREDDAPDYGLDQTHEHGLPTVRSIAGLRRVWTLIPEEVFDATTAVGTLCPDGIELLDLRFLAEPDVAGFDVAAWIPEVLRAVFHLLLHSRHLVRPTGL